MQIEITAEPFSPEQKLVTFARTQDVGAVASFVGYCRGRSHGCKITTLNLQHYPGFTEAEVERLATDVFERCALADLLVVHRVGAIAAGEAIVLVAAQSAHRADALAAVGELMDYLKTEAPIWKQEQGPAGARWIEPTEHDHAAAARRRAEAQDDVT